MITAESCSPATSTPCQKDGVASRTGFVLRRNIAGRGVSDCPCMGVGYGCARRGAPRPVDVRIDVKGTEAPARLI